MPSVIRNIAEDLSYYWGIYRPWIAEQARTYCVSDNWVTLQDFQELLLPRPDRLNTWTTTGEIVEAINTMCDEKLEMARAMMHTAPLEPEPEHIWRIM